MWVQAQVRWVSDSNTALLRTLAASIRMLVDQGRAEVPAGQVAAPTLLVAELPFHLPLTLVVFVIST